MELLYRLDCPPDRFLLDPIEFLPQDIWRQRLKRPRYVTKNGYTQKQIQRMERTLNKVVHENRQPPPLITNIARRLKVRYCFMRWRFPNQYQVIAQRSTNYRAQNARKNFSDRLRRLQRGYRQLMARGIYPSQRALKAYGYLLPSELRLSTVRAELKRLHRNTAEHILKHARKTRARNTSR